MVGSFLSSKIPEEKNIPAPTLEYHLEIFDSFIIFSYCHMKSK